MRYYILLISLTKIKNSGNIKYWKNVQRKNSTDKFAIMPK